MAFDDRAGDDQAEAGAGNAVLQGVLLRYRTRSDAMPSRDSARAVDSFYWLAATH